MRRRRTRYGIEHKPFILSAILPLYPVNDDSAANNEPASELLSAFFAHVEQEATIDAA